MPSLLGINNLEKEVNFILQQLGPEEKAKKFS